MTASRGLAAALAAAGLSAGGTTPRSTPVETTPPFTPLGGEPPTGGRFLLEIDKVEVGVFLQVSGLEVTVDTVTVTEGGQNQFSHKLPGRMSWPNLVFSRGITESNALFEWFTRTSGEGFAQSQNTLKRSTGAVTVIDAAGKRLRAWEFDDVFPVRWKGPTFQIEANDVLVEELELAHHGFRAAKVAGGAGASP